MTLFLILDCLLVFVLRFGAQLCLYCCFMHLPYLGVGVFLLFEQVELPDGHMVELCDGQMVELRDGQMVELPDGKRIAKGL